MLTKRLQSALRRLYPVRAVGSMQNEIPKDASENVEQSTRVRKYVCVWFIFTGFYGFLQN